MADSKTRGLSFGEIADRYDRFRPGVPHEALDWLLRDDSGTVVDVAAGTGALTRSLVGRARHVVAIEPDPRMAEVLGRNCPEALLLEGTVERMPLPDGYADALLICMAWHWMDPQRAMREIARVLRVGGIFGVLWNHRDLSVPWVAALDDFARKLRVKIGSDLALTPTRVAEDPPPGSQFSPLDESLHYWSVPVTAEHIVGLLGTDASAIALPPVARHEVDEQVRRYVHHELGVLETEQIQLPMVCRCLRSIRVSGDAP